MLKIHWSADSILAKHDTTKSGGLDFNEFLTWWSGKDKVWTSNEATRQQIHRIYGIEPEVCGSPPTHP